MALTSEFKNAVNSKKLLRVRIMLKDSLLVDKRFNLFEEMRTYAESRGLHIWMEKTEDIEVVSKAEWNRDLMNLELTRLVNDFTKERVAYCQRIIEKVYGIPPHPVQKFSSQPSGQVSRTVQRTRVTNQPHTPNLQRQISENSADYNIILRSIFDIKKILRDNKTEQGDRIWTYANIESIQVAAKRITAACENIKSRR